MSDVVENKTCFLTFCARTARSVGWGVLLLVILLIIVSGLLQFGFDEVKGFSMRSLMIGRLLRSLLFVFLAFLAADLISLISEPDFRDSWILRNGNKVLYTFVAVIIWNTTWQYVHLFMIADIDLVPAQFFLAFVTILATLLKAITLVAFGQILKIVIPIIGEHKTQNLNNIERL